MGHVIGLVPGQIRESSKILCRKKCHQTECKGKNANWQDKPQTSQTNRLIDWKGKLFLPRFVVVNTLVIVALFGGGTTWTGDFKWREVKTESVATLPPFGPIEGQKWFDRISSQWESQKNRFALIYFGKIRFYLPAFEISRSCRTASGFCRNRLMQTGSSGTLIGWKSGQTTYVPLWDRMEGAWLWTRFELMP
jgi:hypothetical protein